MPRFYSEQDCRRKSDQHWDMAGLARQDGDRADSQHHTQQARLWHNRALDGGWAEGEDE